LAAMGQGWPMAAAHGFKPSFWHAEPRRGTEWWGKSPFGYFWGSFPKVTRRKGQPFQGLCLNRVLRQFQAEIKKKTS
nr:hypothetical protein [Pseudomonas sp. AU10]